MKHPERKVVWQSGEEVKLDVAKELRCLADDIDAGRKSPKRCIVLMQTSYGEVTYHPMGLPCSTADGVAMLEWAKLDMWDSSRP